MTCFAHEDHWFDGVAKRGRQIQSSLTHAMLPQLSEHQFPSARIEIPESCLGRGGGDDCKIG